MLGVNNVEKYLRQIEILHENVRQKSGLNTIRQILFTFIYPENQLYKEVIKVFELVRL